MNKFNELYESIMNEGTIMFSYLNNNDTFKLNGIKYKKIDNNHAQNLKNKDKEYFAGNVMVKIK